MPKRYLKFIFPVILPVLLCACKTHHFVVDDAGILDSKTRAGLENLISSYHKKTTCSIYLYSIKKLPEGEDAGSYTKNIAKELELDKTQLNNDAIIFIALQDRQIIFQPGYGLQFIINAGLSELVVRDLQQYFRQSLYQQGITEVVNQVINLTEKLSWRVKSYSEENIKGQDIIELKDFDIKSRNENFLTVGLKNAPDLILYITKYMAALTGDVSSDQDHNIVIYYRPVPGKPGEGYLINITKK
ncbi:MAG TPA: TPM domain-containing protein [Ginsengibacter sp.]|nr:TPM domain-containing protein [Ginsengibacter sp.]